MLTATHKALIDTIVASYTALADSAPRENAADFLREACDYYALKAGISKEELYRTITVSYGLIDQPLDAVVVVGKRIG